MDPPYPAHLFLRYSPPSKPSRPCPRRFFRPEDHPSEGKSFPDLPLKASNDPRDSEYLKTKANATFRLKDLKADLVLVEIMNINCGSCRKQAPAYNNLYELIESNPDIRGRVKMMSIASGNQDKYIRLYKDHFKVPYPVIEDPEFDMYNAIGRTPTPLAVYVRIDHENNRGIVASAHLGFNEDYQQIYNDIRSLLNEEIPTVQMKANASAPKSGHPDAPFSETKLLAEIVQAFFKHADGFTSVEQVDLGRNEILYTSKGRKGPSEIRLFACVVGRKIPCDLCHDAHFIYIFDHTGRVLDFIPIKLTKYGNEPWDEKDIQKMRQQIVGKDVFNPFPFDARVDAVTSATITSSVVINSMNQGCSLLKKLKEKGLIATPSP